MNSARLPLFIMAPGLVAAAIYALLTVTPAPWRLWIAGETTESLAEAAALGDAGEVVRRIELGADPNVPSRVRAGIVGGDSALVSPVDAAASAHQTDIVRLLDAYGVVGATQLSNRLKLR
jgi:hypothetical protein